VNTTNLINYIFGEKMSPGINRKKFWITFLIIVAAIAFVFLVVNAIFDNFKNPVLALIGFSLIIILFFFNFILFSPIVNFTITSFSRLSAGGNKSIQQEILKKYWVRILSCVIYLALLFAASYLCLKVPARTSLWYILYIFVGPTELIKYCAFNNWFLFLVEWAILIGLSYWASRNKPIKYLFVAFYLFSTFFISIASLILEVLGYHDPFWGMGN
jgi:hypothetical protein